MTFAQRLKPGRFLDLGWQTDGIEDETFVIEISYSKMNISPSPDLVITIYDKLN